MAAKARLRRLDNRDASFSLKMSQGRIDKVALPSLAWGGIYDQDRNPAMTNSYN